MKKEILEDKIMEPLAKLCVNHIKQTECILKCDNISINFWNMERSSLLENEPPKIFKKKHLEWEAKLNEVTEHLKDLYKSKEETKEKKRKKNNKEEILIFMWFLVPIIIVMK